MFLTDTNELCPAKLVDNLEKCTEAVDKIKNEIPNAKFGHSHTWGEYPKGCFLYVNNDSSKDKVFFNEHPTGSGHGHTRHICEYIGSK